MFPRFPRTLPGLLPLVVCLAACAPVPGDPNPQMDLDAARRAVADPLRPDEDRRRDGDRRPAEVLEFFGIRPGMRVLDLMAARGYYTEILSGLVGPEGTVYAQNAPFVLERFARDPLAQRIERLAGAGRTNVETIEADLDEMELPAGLDAAILVRFYHDLFWMPTSDDDLAQRAEMLRRVYDALKPGAVFGIIDHHAPAGSGRRFAAGEENLHRVDEALVREEVLAAGFVLQAASDLLAHPEDTRDWGIFVDDGARRDATDRFVLRFVRPE